jgi:hypothetical protein
MAQGLTFSEEYRLILDAPRVKEPPAASYQNRVPEAVLRCIWYDRLFRSSGLKTSDGRPLSVLSPGRWNFESGPDFRNAVLCFDNGETILGDVEIDPAASDWHAHGHDSDPAYARVELLVVLDPPTARVTPTNVNGKTVAVLVLRDYLEESLDQLAARLDPREYPFGRPANLGACAQPGDVDTLCRIIDMAADWRIISKARQFAADSSEKGHEQAFYEGFMAALGYKKFTEQFRQVARRATLEKLRNLLAKYDQVEHTNVAEAFLLRAAGLIPPAESTHGWDQESQRYHARIKQLAEAADACAPESNADPVTWRSANVRPQNYPARRLAGAARVIADNLQPGIAERCLNLWKNTQGKRTDAHIFTALFTETADSYWSWHYSWGGKKTPKPVGLIGNGRGMQIVVNVIIPFSLAVARGDGNLSLERKIFRTYTACPPLPNNAVLRLMAHRMFGTAKPPASLVSGSRRQQGLIQIYQDWCSQDPACQQCSILPVLSARS